MSSFKVMSIADIHLNGGSDSDEAMALMKAVEVARSGKVDYVLVNGDIFHSKSTPAQRLVFKGFLECLEFSVKEVVILRGNHDEIDDLKIYECDTFGKMDVAVFQKPGSVRFDGNLTIYAIPHFNAAALALETDSQSQMGEDGTGLFDQLLHGIFQEVHASDTPSMVAFHGTVTDAHLDNGMIPKHDGIVLNGPLLSSIGCPVRGGHYHAAQEPHPNVRYSGSITLRNYGESGDKGVLIDECIDGVWQECRFVSLEPSARVTIEAEFTDGWWSLLNVPNSEVAKDFDFSEMLDFHYGDFYNSRVRFRYRVKQSEVASITDLEAIKRHIIEHKGAIELKIERDIIHETAVRNESIHQATTVLDMHEAWLGMKGLENKIPEQRRLYNEIINPVATSADKESTLETAFS
jgi:DNA repair exonuclease SbcCD nuclease subunit